MQLALLIGAIALPIGAAAVMFMLSLPREQDYYAVHLADLLALTNVHRPDRIPPFADPMTGGVVERDDAASFLQERALRGLAAPLDNDRRGGIHLIVNH